MNERLNYLNKVFTKRMYFELDNALASAVGTGKASHARAN